MKFNIKQIITALSDPVTQEQKKACGDLIHFLTVLDRRVDALYGVHRTTEPDGPTPELGPVDIIEQLNAAQAEIEQLRQQVASLESLRPTWHLSERVKANALAQLWELLGVNNQTRAVEQLKALKIVAEAKLP